MLTPKQVHGQVCSTIVSFVLFISYRHRFHEVAALRALMRAARLLRENGNDMLY